jgi:hypothetical protein
MSNFFSDLLFGARPDMRQISGMQPYIDAIPGDPGHIEEMYSLRPVLAAINARTASDYRTGQRQMSKDLAFSEDPMIGAALNSELSGRLNENAGLQFAQAAGGAYQNAADTLESRNRFRKDLEYRSAMDKANLYRNSMYDARRPGGLFQDMLKAGMGAATGGLTSALGSPKRSGDQSSGLFGEGHGPGTWV